MRKVVTGIMAAVIVFLLIIASDAQAQAGPKLKIDITAKKEVSETSGGKTVKKLASVTKANPGETIVFEIEYTNAGDRDAVDSEIVDPMPEGAVYVVGSAEGNGTDITFSIDGGKTYQAPPVYFVSKDAEGKEMKKEAAPEMYTHIKWKILSPLKPGKKGTASFKAIVK